MFPVNGSLRTAPLFPRSGPGESGSPMSQVLLRRYDFPPRISGHLFASLPGSARSSSVRVSQLALPEGRRAFWARVVVQPATQSAGLLARGRERDLPGSQAIHPVPLPRSATPAEPTIPRLLDGFVDAAPALPTAKASAVDEFRGSITRLWHLLPTLQERCRHHPCKTHFSGYWKIVGIACRRASAASRSIRLVKNGSGTMTSPPGRSWTTVAKAISISRSVLAFRTWSCSPRLRAATCSSCNWGSASSGLLGLTSRATVIAVGTSACSSSSRFDPTCAVKLVTPVRLPPGRARLATSPIATGSPPTKNTIGIVVVAALAASVAGVLPGAAITVT